MTHPKRGEPGFHEAAAKAVVDWFLGDWDGTINAGPPFRADRITVDVMDTSRIIAYCPVFPPALTHSPACTAAPGVCICTPYAGSPA